MLDLVHELLPSATSVALLGNPNSKTAEACVRATQDAAFAFKLKLHVLKTRAEHKIEATFDALAKLRAGGFLIGADPFFEFHREQLIALAASHGAPTEPAPGQRDSRYRRQPLGAQDQAGRCVPRCTPKASTAFHSDLHLLVQPGRVVVRQDRTRCHCSRRTSVPDLKRKLMSYIRHYNKQPKPVKWKYFDPTRRITPESIVTIH